MPKLKLLKMYCWVVTIRVFDEAGNWTGAKARYYFSENEVRDSKVCDSFFQTGTSQQRRAEHLGRLKAMSALNTANFDVWSVHKEPM